MTAKIPFYLINSHNFPKSQQEEDGMNTFTAKLQSLVGRFLNQTAAVEAETEHNEEENQRNEAQKQTLIVINEMDGTLQEIEELCGQHGEEIKAPAKGERNRQSLATGIW